VSKYEPLPELDNSLPDNDLGSMVVAIIIVACALVGLVIWSLK
jgi:hypothetical protein